MENKTSKQWLERMVKNGKIFQKPNVKHISKNAKIIIAISVFLSFLGLIMMYSAGRYQGETVYGDAFYFVKKQLVGVVLGLVCMCVLACVNAEFLKEIATPFAVISAVLLILVFIPYIGVENYGAKRWIKVVFFTIQPSDIAKFAFIIFSAKALSKSVDVTFLSRLQVYILGGVYMLLIFLEPNLSITICFALLMLSMLVAGGLEMKHLLFFIALGLCALPVLIWMEPYRLKRLFAFVDPFASPKGEGFQLIQSLYALASGGLFGVGLFDSRQSLRFLPFGESDFIFAIYVEEFGFVGGVVLVAIYVCYIFAGVKIAISAKSRFQMYLAFGISMLVAIQTMINIAVVIGAIPPTGLPLPFVSSGNTQVIMFLGMSGTLVSIAMGENSQKPLARHKL
ncbi:MAG: putative peptidoglycan glycosyltransferase FtsW [Bacillota bacterium]